MLRRIRARLRPPLPSLHRATRTSTSPIAILRQSSSAVAYKVREDDESEPYGMEYGAGPSRIPYQPLRRHDLSDAAVAPYVPARLAARTLRERLQDVPQGTYAQLTTFLRKTLDRDINRLDRLSRPLSRLELHTILHHLIREGKGNLAAALVWEAISTTPRMIRHRLFRDKSIAALFQNRKIFSLPSAGSVARRHPPPNRKPTLGEQTNLAPSVILTTLINILEALQDIRFRRSTHMYWLVIRQCVEELQPDLAAKIYVGMVEEWVTEGRVAEGADPEDFHPGGGPPRAEILERKKISDMVKRWWIGVRTWRLPGEVLSPHDRLDLWHPRHLSLGEKMRNFPFPLATSPPSIVPQPNSQMLSKIIQSLTLNPTKCSPAQFASSMRALALLANTVLSRTLPISSLGELLQVFNTAPSKPDVFPDNVTVRPEEDAWAYTAFTQIHVTLMSLLFSPPISADSIRLAEAHRQQRALTSAESLSDVDEEDHPDRERVTTQRSSETRATPVSPYMLPPLSFASCRIILYYALKSFGRPAALRKLVTYIKDTFGMGGANPSAYNIFLEVGTFLRDNALARQAEIILFGPARLELSTSPSSFASPQMDERTFFSSRRIDETFSQTSVHELDLTPPAVEPIPDQNSLILLLNHLAATSQFDRLLEYVYRLIPFLEFSANMTDQQVADKRELLGIPDDDAQSKSTDIAGPKSRSGRPTSDIPTALTPEVYTAILSGLEKAGKTGLAQRVFKIALREEARAVEQYISAHSTAPGQGDAPWSAERIRVPEQLRLPMEAFTTMLRVWGNEYQSSLRANFASRSLSLSLRSPDFGEGREPTMRRPRGWVVPPQYRKIPWELQPAQMAMMVHELVRQRYHYRANRGTANEEYYEALIRACAGRWGLDKRLTNQDLTQRRAAGMGWKKEMRHLVEIMQKGGVEVPDVIWRRLQGQEVYLSNSKMKMRLWGEEEKQEKERQKKEEREEERNAPGALLNRLMGQQSPTQNQYQTQARARPRAPGPARVRTSRLPESEPEHGSEDQREEDAYMAWTRDPHDLDLHRDAQRIDR